MKQNKRTISLDNELQQRLDAETNASAVVRDALRAYYGLPRDATLDTVLAELRDLRADLQRGIVTVALPPVEGEDADLVAALENLGL